MKTLIAVLTIAVVVSFAGAFSKRYCDFCDVEIKDRDNRYLQSVSHNYSDICDSCYHYLDVRITEVIEDIRRASAMTPDRRTYE